MIDHLLYFFYESIQLSIQFILFQIKQTHQDFSHFHPVFLLLFQQFFKLAVVYQIQQLRGFPKRLAGVLLLVKDIEYLGYADNILHTGQNSQLVIDRVLNCQRVIKLFGSYQPLFNKVFSESFPDMGGILNFRLIGFLGHVGFPRWKYCFSDMATESSPPIVFFPRAGLASNIERASGELLVLNNHLKF
ncbi:MAG TPA: hypothetical protein VM123_09155 [archaeon]|nr:hypothetical protein [archaeon]